MLVLKEDQVRGGTGTASATKETESWRYHYWQERRCSLNIHLIICLESKAWLWTNFYTFVSTLTSAQQALNLFCSKNLLSVRGEKGHLLYSVVSWNVPRSPTLNSEYFNFNSRVSWLESAVSFGNMQRHFEVFHFPKRIKCEFDEQLAGEITSKSFKHSWTKNPKKSQQEDCCK